MVEESKASFDGIEELTEEEKNRRYPHRWVKGQSGNPRGSHKRGESWREIIKEVGDREVPEEYQKYGKTYREAVVVRAYQSILRGNVAILPQLWRYSEPPEQVVRVDVHNWQIIAAQNQIPIDLIYAKARELALLMNNAVKALPAPKDAVEGEFKELEEEGASDTEPDDAGDSGVA